MSPDFLCSVVSACPYANASGLLPYIMRCSHVLRTASRTFAEERGADVGGKNRSRGSLICIFNGKIEKTVLLSDDEQVDAYNYIGLAVGFPVAIHLVQEAKGTVGLYAHVGIPLSMPPGQGYDVKGGINCSAGFDYLLTVAPKSWFAERFFDGVHVCGWEDFSDRKWGEVIFPDSPYFFNGELAVQLTMTPIMTGVEEEEMEEEDDDDDDDDDDDEEEEEEEEEEEDDAA